MLRYIGWLEETILELDAKLSRFLHLIVFISCIHLVKSQYKDFYITFKWTNGISFTYICL